MQLFSFGRGKIDKWYKKEIHKLDTDYYAYKDPEGSTGREALARANDKQRELTKAKEALSKEYHQRLKGIGQKPRSDFSSSKDE